jgi:hypothetical protein
MLSGEEEIFEITKKIRSDAKEQQINLDDPKHKHTVWADSGGRMIYVDSFPDENAAFRYARAHAGSNNFYVALGPTSGLLVMKI